MLGLELRELLIILIVVFFFFGAGRMPEIGRSLGQGIREFKKAMNEIGSGSAEDPKEIKSVKKTRLRGQVNKA